MKVGTMVVFGGGARPPLSRADPDWPGREDVSRLRKPLGLST